MWCGKCYTSNENLEFFIKGKAEYETEPEGDRERLQAVWGSRHQAISDFKHARDGDHLLVPFECDTCVYTKVKGHPPPERVVLRVDELLLATIRRAILDSFWSRASTTVRANKNKVRLALELSATMGLDGPYEQGARMPAHDHCGYEVALQMLQASRRPGKHSSEYTQWDTIRQIRTAYSNFSKAATQENSSSLAFADDKGMAQRLVTDPCSSLWFSRFFAGCRRRMGQDWRPNKAVSTELIVAIVDKVQTRMMEGEGNPKVENDWLTFGTFLVISYVLSLRGPEGLLLDLRGLISFEEKGGTEGGLDYFVIPLLGKVKGEHQDRCHLFPCVSITSSRIPVKNWVYSLLNRKRADGYIDGPAISDLNGKVKTTTRLDEQLVEVLEDIYDETPSLFPASITSKDDINIFYSVFRTPRRSSATRAMEKNVSVSDIESVNRWESKERAKGNRPNFPMRQHYTQVELLLKPFLRYTNAM